MYVCIEGKEGKKTSIYDCLVHPQLGTQPTTQAYALTGNWTVSPLVRRPILNPLSYASRGSRVCFWSFFVLTAPWILVTVVFLGKIGSGMGRGVSKITEQIGASLKSLNSTEFGSRTGNGLYLSILSLQGKAGGQQRPGEWETHLAAVFIVAIVMLFWLLLMC